MRISGADVKRGTNKYCYVIAAVVVCLVAAPFLVEKTSEATRDKFISEGGVVETLSVLGYFACFFYVLCRGKFSFLKKFWYIHATFILFAFRELDFHKKFTTMGIFKSKFYLSPQVPVVEKFFASMVLLLLLLIVYLFVKNHGKSFWQGIRERNLFALTISLPILLLIVSKSIDGLARKLSGLGIEVSHGIDRFASSVEEVFELGIPVICLIAMMIYFNEYLGRKMEDENQ